jgi:hypothetical protein
VREIDAAMWFAARVTVTVPSRTLCGELAAPIDPDRSSDDTRAS